MDTRNKHVLVIDDSADHQILLKQLLKSEGYSLSSAQNGLEALKMLRSMGELPSLIMLDLMMPVMDGFTFRQEQLKDSRLANIPVVIMSADSNVEAKAEQLRIHDFIRKPIDIDQLLEVVEKVS